MAEASVIDELVVKLTLDAEAYTRAHGQIDININQTEKKLADNARKTDRRDKDQQKRLKDVAAGVRTFAATVASAVTIVAGLGVTVGATLGNFLGFETALRRQAVGTGFSNREMQAWSASARRLGADANAGAEAIANLAREQKTGILTGNAPTLQALARIGVNANPNTPVQDVLAQAQSIYRAAPKGQQEQIESTLVASGVSGDLILMIKSELDAREVFARSFSQAAEENRKALDQLADAFESIKATAITVSATLLEALQPAIAAGAIKLSEFATDVAKFSRDVQAAGGGVDGFVDTLRKRSVVFDNLAKGIDEAGKQINAVVSLIKFALNAVPAWITQQYRNVSNLGTPQEAAAQNRAEQRIAKDLSNIGNAVSDAASKAAKRASGWWDSVLETAGRSTDKNPYGLPQNIEDAPADNPYGLPENIEENAPKRRPTAANPVTADAQMVMTKLITKHGLSSADAAAVVANWQRESGLRTDAVNPAGGGTGARGIGQWRGERTEAFERRYGVKPDRATLDQQVEFAMTDPYEKALMTKSLAAGGDAATKGRAVSQYYEAHGNVAEDIRRGKDATMLQAAYDRTAPAARAGTTVTIQNMTVQAQQPEAFVGGLERIADTQNYNTVIR